MPHPDQRLVTTAFTATILFSAFLLFSVQPMFAKMVLPVLGGAPAVWAVSLCFFQALLLLGYAYAHLLVRLATPKLALVLHIAVMALALVALPVALPGGWAATAPDGAYLWLIGILAVGVGLPFFALAANAPLLQAWFARSAAPGTDAYSLYAASNTGSLGALLAYPFLIEPLLPLSLQSRVWAAAFVLLGGMIGWCGYLMLQAPAERPSDPASSGPASPATWRMRATWAALAFIPSGLLVAFTTFVTTDIAAVPLLWVVPLALYLATFIVVFRPRLPVGRNLLLIAQLVAVPVALATMDWDATFAWALSCLAGTIAFLATCLICHRQLYERRPDPERLTDFYLWMSAGGALGGIFSALVAPQMFTDLLEFPLLLGLGLLCRLGWRDATAPDTDRWRRLAAALAGVAALVLVTAAATAFGLIAWTPQLRLYALAGLGAAVIACWRWPLLELTAAAALILAVALVPNGNKPVHVARSFFGTHKVVEPPGGAFRLLLHGTTLHGAQRINDPRVAAGLPPMPVAYHHPAGPLARSLTLARAAAGGPTRPLRVGIVGLGAGAMACHALPGDRWRFFEIDPEVVRIATDPAYFTYLGTCQPGADIVLGDARLTLAREPKGSFDYLIMDAFASDAVPIHLLTVEAIRLYGELLSERGVLVLHVSNQHLDLPPIVEANVGTFAGLSGVYAEGENRGGAIRSQVILVAKDAAILAPALAWHKARPLGATAVRPWSDDYSDILSPLIRRYRDKLASDGR